MGTHAEACLNLLLLSPSAGAAAVADRVTRAAESGSVAAVTVPPVHVAPVARLLTSLQVPMSFAAAVSYPHGYSKSTVKAIEGTSCLKDGALELLVCPHLPPLLARDYGAVKAELLEIARATRTTRRDVHLRLVLDLLLLPPELLLPAAQVALESAFDSVHLAPAIPAAVRALAPHLPVESAAGRADHDGIEAMLAAGATRVAVAALPEG